MDAGANVPSAALRGRHLNAAPTGGTDMKQKIAIIGNGNVGNLARKGK